MSDPTTMARTARDSLARGLNALQSDPNVPKQLLELATPIAGAMSALHQIERSNGTQLMPHAEVALNNVRGALGQLQAQPATHAAVAQALEAVASSLGQVHALSKMAQGPAAAPPQQQPPQAQRPPQQAQQQQPAQQQPQQPAARPGTQPVAARPAPQPQPGLGFAPTAIGAPPQQQQQPMRAPQQGPNPYAAADPFAAPRNPPYGGQPPQQAAPLPPPGDAQVITADLGAHSATNFYKGLSGNDIIDHGGLFVSTYMIPKIGTPVRLRVSLPGGYEFEANAIVKWAREAADDASDAAPPGFGAQFTQITPEARQLVYRYVRNREPLFHDDL